MDIWTNLGRFSVFETQRLLLRPFAFSDSDAFFDIVHQPENLQFIFPAQASKEESDFLLTHYFMKNPLGIWAIEDKSTCQLIGSIRLENLRLDESTAEIGYFIKHDYRRQGLMTEVVRNIVFLSGQTLLLKKLVIIAHKENKASIRVAEKAGFRLVKQFKGSDRYSHKIRDYVRYELKLENTYE